MLLTQALLLAAIPLATATSSNTRTQDIVSIQQTLNRYPLAIDSKSFADLADVFMPDAVADYGAGVGVLTGLSGIEAGLAAVLAPVTTQHALTTQVVDFSAHEHNKANATTYLTATHFGAGRADGKVLYAYGQYRDEVTKMRGGRGGEEWRISRRTLVYMGPLTGDLSVFQPS